MSRFTMSTSNLSLSPSYFSDGEIDLGLVNPSGKHALSRQGSTDRLTTTGTKASPRDIHGYRWVLVVMSVFSCVFLFALDNTIVADVQPAIIEEFGNLALLPWISVAFMLAGSSTLLLFGKAYGLLNCKWLYIGTTLLFEIGSAVCGAAPNMNIFIIGRAICGLGGAGMYTGVMTIISMLTTPVERPAYLGMIGLTWGTGTVLGPIIGGGFTDSAAGWRWSFYINLCIGAIFAPVFFFMIPNIDPRPGVPLRTRLAEMDWIGNSIFIGAFVMVIMSISFGGVEWAWNDSRIIGMFAGSAATLAIFFLQQSFMWFTSYTNRCFPMQYLKRKEMVLLFLAAAAAGTASFAPIYFIPMYFQFVKGDAALEAGVRLLPFIVPMVFFNLANGVGLSAWGYYKPWFLAGGSLVLVGGALLKVVGLSTSVTHIYGALVAGGIGVGLFSQAGFAVAQSLVPPEEITMAVGFMNTGQLGGSTIALAIANAIFLNRATIQIMGLVPGQSVTAVQAMIAGSNNALMASLSDETRLGVLKAIVTSITDALTLALTSGAVALAAAVFLGNGKMQFASGEVPMVMG